jgi:hypothetical protein
MPQQTPDSAGIRPTSDRRVGPDRREGWRGGRRDTDWTGRPADGTADTGVRPAPAWWQRLLRRDVPPRADFR